MELLVYMLSPYFYVCSHSVAGLYTTIVEANLVHMGKEEAGKAYLPGTGDTVID